MPLSLNERLESTGGRPAGFDYLRLILSILVVVWHTTVNCYGQSAQAQVSQGPTRALWVLLIPMFFSLSGFLVAGSLDRNKTLAGFLGLRLIRIFPALVVEVVLSALILGPIFTHYPLATYFQRSDFWTYLLNITGDIHYILPGVFDGNPNPKIVNGQLWTVPFELYCYACLAVLIALSGKFIRLTAPAAALLITVAGVAIHFNRPGWPPPSFMPIPGRWLIVTFLCGVSLYMHRRLVAWDWRLFLISAVATELFIFTPGGEALVSLPIAYLTVYLGLLDPKRVALLRGADYSYGIFLYGFPLQQAVAAQVSWGRHWYLNLPLALTLVAVVAMGSWNFVEKPALLLRKPIKELDDYCWRSWQRLRRRPESSAPR